MNNEIEFNEEDYDTQFKWYYDEMKQKGIPEMWGGGYYWTEGYVVMPDGRLEEMD